MIYSFNQIINKDDLTPKPKGEKPKKEDEEPITTGLICQS